VLTNIKDIDRVDTIQCGNIRLFKVDLVKEKTSRSKNQVEGIPYRIMVYLKTIVEEYLQFCYL
jgi:hypothetical protein